MDEDAVRERAGELPREPGVYQFEDGDAVVYVGKAVDLRDRVRSYGEPRSRRIRRMVDRADRIDYSVTDTETQALLLEANLIKRFQPRYNVRLKDDKSYPLVQLTGHEFPRIEVTRDPDPAARARSDGGVAASRAGSHTDPRVFGPFTDKTRVETVVKALRETYGVRGCSDHKFADRDRPCLDHDIGLCTAPCTGEIDRESYVADVESVVRFFEGETGVLADPLRREMERAAADRQFERAANLRDRLDAVEGFHGGAGEAVASETDERTVDVLGVALEGESATVARLHSESGQLVARDRHAVTIPDDEPDAGDGSETRVDTPAGAVLSAFVTQFYAERDLPDAVLFSDRPDDEEVLDWLDREGVAARVPGAGREATLVDLALKNARRGASEPDALAALRDALNLDAVPRRIEGFDVSHAQGRAVVGSDVTFVDGSPEKTDYRRKKLDDRNDDYRNMRDLVRWRAERAVDAETGGDTGEDRPDPDLLLIDGGEAQLDAARDALAEAGWEVPAIALAKDEEVVVTPDGTFDWPADADHLHVLQRVRDEAHRFAVRYHQTVRDDVSTELDNVPGVGPETRKALLRRFGSVEGIRAASTEELRAVEGVGEKMAGTLRTQL